MRFRSIAQRRAIMAQYGRFKKSGTRFIHRVKPYAIAGVSGAVGGAALALGVGGGTKALLRRSAMKLASSARYSGQVARYAAKRGDVLASLESVVNKEVGRMDILAARSAWGRAKMIRPTVAIAPFAVGGATGAMGGEALSQHLQKRKRKR